MVKGESSSRKKRRRRKVQQQCHYAILYKREECRTEKEFDQQWCQKNPPVGSCPGCPIWRKHKHALGWARNIGIGHGRRSMCNSCRRLADTAGASLYSCTRLPTDAGASQTKRIDIEKLPAYACVVRRNMACLLHDRGLHAEAIVKKLHAVAGGHKMWAFSAALKHTKLIDATSNAVLSAASDAVLPELVADHEAMLHVTNALALPFLGLNINTCCGLYRATAVSAPHQHMLGVLNLLGGDGARKRWTFTDAVGGDEYKITQESGDVLWIPPGVKHGVLTECVQRGDAGKKLAKPAVAGWTTWCVPRRMAERVGMYMLSGCVKEGQVTSRTKTLSVAERKQIGILLGAWAASAEQRHPKQPKPW